MQNDDGAFSRQVYEENGQRAIPYYALIIDPNSMMHTFNNSFQLSFLFRDGFVDFEIGADGQPAVRPAVPTQRGDDDDDDRDSFTVPLNGAIVQVIHADDSYCMHVLCLPRRSGPARDFDQVFNGKQCSSGTSNRKTWNATIFGS